MAKWPFSAKPGSQENSLNPNDRDQRVPLGRPINRYSNPEPRWLQTIPFSHLPCLPRGCGESRQSKGSESALKSRPLKAHQPDQLIFSVQETRRFPRRKRAKDRERVWPRAAVPFGSHLRKRKFRRENPRARSQVR